MNFHPERNKKANSSLEKLNFNKGLDELKKSKDEIDAEAHFMKRTSIKELKNYEQIMQNNRKMNLLKQTILNNEKIQNSKKSMISASSAAYQEEQPLKSQQTMPRNKSLGASTEKNDEYLISN